jgi:hypothetical protein
MRRITCFLAICLLLGTFWGCGTTRGENAFEPTPSRTSSAKIKVDDVSNNTGELFDVDVIGLLWGSLDDSLKQRGLLWTGDTPAPPLKLEAHITEYRKGHIVTRSLMPFWGKTVLAVRCDLKDGDRVIATVESEHTISIGRGTFTFGAWKKVFSAVAEEVVSKLALKV